MSGNSLAKKDADLLIDLQREHTVMQVLSLLLFEKDEDGKKYTITRACEAAGISTSTWYNWVEEGIVSNPLQTIELGFAFL